MSKIKFPADEKEHLVKKIQFYFDQELEQELGQFDAEFLLDFFAEEVGSFFYNRGLYDAQAFIEKKIESITEEIYELEKSTDLNS